MPSITFKGKPVTLIGPEIKPGDKAPDFTVLANDLTPVTLADTKGCSTYQRSSFTGYRRCDAQTRRFNEEAANLPHVKILTISVDLPFAQKRWCGAAESKMCKHCRITATSLSVRHTVLPLKNCAFWRGRFSSSIQTTRSPMPNMYQNLPITPTTRPQLKQPGLHAEKICTDPVLRRGLFIFLPCFCW